MPTSCRPVETHTQVTPIPRNPLQAFLKGLALQKFLFALRIVKLASEVVGSLTSWVALRSASGDTGKKLREIFVGLISILAMHYIKVGSIVGLIIRLKREL